MDPLDSPERRRRPPLGVLVLWLVAILIFVGAGWIIVRGEQTRSELAERAQQG